MSLTGYQAAPPRVLRKKYAAQTDKSKSKLISVLIACSFVGEEFAGSV